MGELHFPPPFPPILEYHFHGLLHLAHSRQQPRPAAQRAPIPERVAGQLQLLHLRIERSKVGNRRLYDRQRLDNWVDRMGGDGDDAGAEKALEGLR